ncbi:tetratricopeptide repeat protein [Winogradskyella forsetii]|uniref:tetratricopeptide repeat protein n=1 Tax=Winogradskyella forsetii TaxID=2686077 RepID=UPI0015B84074|nr:tetratricopeptide repeat protein [Winogradskyella forsetii]
MTSKSTLFFIFLVFCIGVMNAQKEVECNTKLSFFHEDVKAKKYNEAYEPWLYVKNNCPDLNIAIYIDGEKILNHKIDTSEGKEKQQFIEDLIVLWQERQHYFTSRTPKGEYEAKACQLKYDYKDELGKTQDDLYNCFNAAFKTDSNTFTHPKSLYSYFSVMVNLFDEGKKTDAELFNTYDNINEKIESEIQNYSEKLNDLIEKLESGQSLTNKEDNLKTVCESYLENYALIQQNINAKLDIRAVCENLIPLYTKDFETYKNDAVWLKRSVSRMYHKECTEDPLYEKLVKQYDEISPSADTKIFVATLLIKNGKTAEANQYLEEAYHLETDAFKKSNLAIRIGVILKNQKQYSKARNYFNKALNLNPSNGKPHLSIGEMYNDSAKDCGKDNFYKRAVYWLAAKEVKKASRLDPTLQKKVNEYVANYEAKAPTKQEVFLRDMAGKTIEIGCWINSSIVVPKF